MMSGLLYFCILVFRNTKNDWFFVICLPDCAVFCILVFRNTKDQSFFVICLLDCAVFCILVFKNTKNHWSFVVRDLGIQKTSGLLFF